jgi:hypothetical protein
MSNQFPIVQNKGSTPFARLGESVKDKRSSAHIEASVTTKKACWALLDHLAYIAEPSTGAPTMLLVFARMATTACVWLEGGLRIELHRDRDTVWIDVLTEPGESIADRVFPSIAVHVPLEEFLGAVERVPEMVNPLSVVTKTHDCLTLGAIAYVRRTSGPMPAVSDACAFDRRGNRD